MTAVASSIFEERADPGRILSALLAAAMHALLFLVLLFGVRWQNRPPEAVQVELWTEPAAVQAPAPEEPKPLPKVEPAPPPPQPVAKPEPVIAKPEIVEKKAPPPKPVPKPVVKVEPKPKPEPPKAVAKPRDEEAQRQFREQMLREQNSLAIDRERQMLKDLAAHEASSANTKAQAAWIDKVRLKIKGNIFLPLDIKGNPEASFNVVQLPTGEVLSVKLKKSSGMATLDAAIERAVWKSSPLPKPDSGFTPPREFELRYKPLD